jgi:hypothetical protein
VSPPAPATTETSEAEREAQAVILGDPQLEDAQAAGRTTLDGLFRKAVAHRPDAIALSDPPNRPTFTDGSPLRLSYAEADRIVTAIAAQLRQLDFGADTVVGIQLPNTVEAMLTILGTLRARMIPAMLPLLWRRADLTAALGRIGAKIIITTSWVGEVDLCGMAMRVAADMFSIRHVCSFGEGVGDGIIPFDELLTAADFEAPTSPRKDNAADHIALITFDVTADGLVPVARSHTQLIAGGLASVLEGNLQQESILLACCMPGSFAGLALSLAPWLLTSGTLALHHLFDPLAFSVQCNFERCDTIILPGPVVPQLAAAQLLAHSQLKNVLAYWRAPERLRTSPPWRHASIKMIDMLAFGEIALLGARRGRDGTPAALLSGKLLSPRGSPQGVLLTEAAQSSLGSLALRGRMVPYHPFPIGAERLPLPCLRIDADGFVDTGFSCRLDDQTRHLVLTGPPPGIVTVGGYRFVLRELEHLAKRADPGAILTALPDALAGHRLAGVPGASGDICETLIELGVNPLLIEAFRDRRGVRAA